MLMINYYYYFWAYVCVSTHLSGTRNNLHGQFMYAIITDEISTK